MDKTGTEEIQKLEAEKDIKGLIAVISKEKGPDKRAAILALGRIADPQAVDALLGMFTEENEWYYDEIFEALGKSGDKRAIEPLLKMYRRFQLNPSLTEALGRLGDPRAVDLFKANLLDAGSSVRHAAAWGLITFNDPATKEEAFSVLRDKEDITDAAATGSARLVEMLLMAGVNVDTKTSGGYTPLLIAAGRGRTEVVKLLLDAGADVKAVGESKRTAYQLAMDRDYGETAALIHKHGGV